MAVTGFVMYQSLTRGTEWPSEIQDCVVFNGSCLAPSSLLMGPSNQCSSCDVVSAWYATSTSYSPRIHQGEKARGTSEDGNL